MNSVTNHDIAREYYISSSGNDSNSGTIDMPFLSIEKARDEIRQDIKMGVQGNIIVYIRGGNYYIDNTIVFDERDSAKEGYTIKYMNYPGEEPVIIGGKLITNWEDHIGNIKKAYVGNLRFNSLYENGRRQSLARFPSEGYMRVADKVEGDQQKKIVIDTKEIMPFDYSEASIYLWPGDADWNWFSETHQIEDIDWGNGTVTFKNETRYPMNKGARYFLQGANEFLNSPGEFYLDKKDGYLYFWSSLMSVSDQEITVPTVKEIIKLKGSNNSNLVENIEFEGLSFTITDSGEEHRNPIEHDGKYFETYELDENRLGIFSFENARNNVIRFCHISNSGFCGVILNNYAQKNTIYGCLIEEVGFNGVYLLGHNIGISDVNRDNIIENNLIRNGGKLVGHGSGIVINQSGHNRIIYNRVYDFPRYCISIKGLQYNRLEGKVVKSVPITWENHKEFIHSRDNIIAYNDVSGANKDSQDTGLIEAWGAGKGNKIHNNFVHDSATPMGQGLGIYLDDEASYFTVTNNIITNINNANCMCIKGTNNLIQNNIMVNNQTHQALCLMELDNVIIKGNIIYNSGDVIYDFANCSEKNINESDDNIFFNEMKQYKFSRLKDIENLAEWQEVTGFDRNSIVCDPGVVRLDDGKVVLVENSPAFDLGFTDIPVNIIGLKEDFPFEKKKLKNGMLDNKGWEVEAFDDWYKNIARNVLDGNDYTRWTSGKAQEKGQWFQVDMGLKQSFNKLILYCEDNYPRSLDVYISEDKINWQKQKIQKKINKNRVEITFPEVCIRYIRLVVSEAAGSTWWAMNRLEIYQIELEAIKTRGDSFDVDDTIVSHKESSKAKWNARAGWTTLDNVSNPYIAGNPILAIDGNDHTKWRFEGYQSPGQWLVVDFDSNQCVDEICLNCDEGYPKEFEVYVSNENGKWTGPICSQKGKEGLNTITIPLSEIRYLGIVQTYAFGFEAFSIRNISLKCKKGV